MIGQGVRIGLSFLATVLVSRWLGAKGFGEINLILGYTSFLAYLLTFGFDISLPFYSSKLSNKQKEGNLESVFFAGVINTLIGGSIVLATANYFLPSLLKINNLNQLLIPARLLCLQTLIIALGSVFAGYLRGEKKFWSVILKDQFLFGISHFVGVIFFIKVLELDILGYAISYTVASCAGFIAVLIAVVKKIKEGFYIHLSIENWKAWSLFSFPLSVMNTLEPMINWSSILIVGFFLTAKDVGQISIALRLAFFIQFIFVALQPIFSPFIADLIKKGDSSESETLLSTVCYWSAKWSLLFSFFLFHSSPFILTFFGDSYSSANTCLLILIPGFLFEGLFGPIKQTLIMAGHIKVNLVNLFFSLFLNTVLSFLLIPQLGLSGGALSFTITYIILNLVRVGQIYIYFKIWPFRFQQVKNLSLIILALLIISTYSFIIIDIGHLFFLTLFFFLTGIVVLYWRDRIHFLNWMKRKKLY